ncbi:MAG: MurR/RpiR family transcriptional regulator [Sphaerochaetaceae bacterium]|nr:MurR/RpiR family transcriptional regulator [Sphaerochaetaceae bacterium]
MKTVTELIAENFDMLTNSHKKVAKFIQHNLNLCAFKTLEEIAKQINVSTTTVIRFSRALGFAGFSDLQRNIQNNIQIKESLPDRLLNITNECPNEVFKQSFLRDIENIQITMNSQNDKNLKSVINCISDAKNVFILGMRSAFSVAFYMASRLGEIKANIHLIQSVGLLYPEEIVNAEKGDACIAYLFPRYSKQTTAMISWLKKQGVKIILITSMDNSLVASYGDFILPCAVKSLYYKNSYAGPMCLTNYLVTSMTLCNKEEAKKLLIKTEEILQQGFYLGI